MNVLSILDELGITYKTEGEHHHARHGWVQLNCPFCGMSNNSYHLGINLAGLYASCWRCGSHTLAEALVHITGIRYADIRPLLANVDRGRLIKREQKRGKLVLPKGIGPLLKLHKNYLIDRGLGSKDAKLWNIQGIGLASKLAWRIFIPIYFRGEVISWTTRAVKGKGQRYISASPDEESVNHKHVLFGIDLCRHSIIITEGPFDAMRIGPGAAASLGLGLSAHQMLLASRFPIRVLCFDSEPIAQLRARETAKLLASYPGETHTIELESGKDASEADEEEIQEIRKLLV